jgi:hypothetical protein
VACSDTAEALAGRHAQAVSASATVTARLVRA